MDTLTVDSTEGVYSDPDVRTLIKKKSVCTTAVFMSFSTVSIITVSSVMRERMHGCTNCIRLKTLRDMKYATCVVLHHWPTLDTVL